MNFSENLKKYRKKIHLSQQQLADKMKIAQSTVGMWESGKRTPKLDEINRLAKALQISIERLVGKQQKIEIVKDEIFVDGKRVEELDAGDINEILRLILDKKNAKKPSGNIDRTDKAITGKKVLVIDDEQELCDAIYSFLVPHNYRVFISFNATMGMEFFHKIDPDIVLLDLTMPDINGIDVLKTLRKISDVPVIIITAHPEDIADIHLEELDISGYIEKPFSLEQVLSMLKQLLGD